MWAASRAAVGGEQASVSELEELYVGSIAGAVALARLVSADASIAEDLAHEAFIRAASKIGALRDRAAFDRYLRRTVVNLCRMRWRRLGIERRSLDPLSDVTTQPDLEERDELWTAIADLPFRQRAAVVLRFYEDLSEAQTAEVLRCSPRAVNSLISRAMASLRLRLDREDD